MIKLWDSFWLDWEKKVETPSQETTQSAKRSLVGPLGLGCGCLVLFMVFGACLCFGLQAVNAVYVSQTQEEVTGKVVDTYVKYDPTLEKDIFYAALEFPDGTREVFRNTDELLFRKFDSADMQQRLIQIQEEGSTCSFKVAGKRIEALSQFRNIVEISDCRSVSAEE